MHALRLQPALFLFAATCVGGHAQSCSVVQLQRLSATAHDQQRALLQVPVPDMESDVPASVQQQITRWKQALVDVVDATMICNTGNDDALSASLLSNLAANTSRNSSVHPEAEDQATTTQVYANHLRLQLSRPQAQPDLLAVQISFDIPCGDDTLLLLYPGHGTARHRVLRWQSPPYSSIADAFGSPFLFGLLPDAPGAPWRVVVTHGTDWCTSRFSAASIDVLEPAESANTPRILWHTQRILSRGDFVTRLSTHGNDFEIRWNAPALDPDDYERTVIYHYRVLGNAVTRLGPIAVNSRGFVAEWLNMPWTEAKGLTEAPKVDRLRQFHAWYEQASRSSDTYPSYTYGPVLACSNGSFQVEMEMQQGKQPSVPQYFRLRETRAGYTLVDENSSPDHGCGGPDLMQPRK